MSKKKKTTKKKTTRAPKPDTRAPNLDYIAEGLRPFAVPISELLGDPRNAMVHDADNLRGIAASFKAFGQRQLVVVNKRNGQIEAGNARAIAAGDPAYGLGWTHLAVLYVDDDPATQHGYALADNRTAALAEWDQEMLDGLLKDYGDEWGDLQVDLMLAELQAELGPEEQAEEEGTGEADGNVVPDSWQVVVRCKDEEEQTEVWKEFKGRGYDVRLLTL